MKKRMMAIYTLVGALAASPIFTSCVDENESASVENVRNARAEQMKSWAALVSAQGEADRIKAEAEVAYNKAETDFLKAKENSTAEEAAMLREIYAATLSKIKAESEMQILLVQQKKNAIEKEAIESADNYLLSLYANDKYLSYSLQDLNSQKADREFDLKMAEVGVYGESDVDKDLSARKEKCIKKNAKLEKEIQKLEIQLKDIESIEQESIQTEELTNQLREVYAKLLKAESNYSAYKMDVLEIEEQIRLKLMVLNPEFESEDIEDMSAAYYFMVSPLSTHYIHLAQKEPYKYTDQYYKFARANDFFEQKKAGNQLYSWFFNPNDEALYLVKGELKGNPGYVPGSFGYNLFSVKSKKFHEDVEIHEEFDFDYYDGLNSYEYLVPDEEAFNNFNLHLTEIDKDYAEAIKSLDEALATAKKDRDDKLTADKDADVSYEDAAIKDITETIEQYKKEKESFKQLIAQLDTLVAMTAEDSPEMKEYLAGAAEVSALFDKVMDARIKLMNSEKELDALDFEIQLLIAQLESFDKDRAIEEIKSDIEFNKQLIKINESYLEGFVELKDIIKGEIAHLEERMALIQKLIDANQAEIKRVLEMEETK